MRVSGLDVVNRIQLRALETFVRRNRKYFVVEGIGVVVLLSLGEHFFFESLNPMNDDFGDVGLVGEGKDEFLLPSACC